MIDELRDLTRDLIDAFCLSSCFTTSLYWFFILVLVTRYSTVRQLTFLLTSKHDIGIGTKAWAVPAVPEGAIRRQLLLRTITYHRMGRRKAHGDIHLPQTKEVTKR